jgi:N-acetylglucosaminyl-diphospho-decaprenol L-rhamnosyltransferase
VELLPVPGRLHESRFNGRYPRGWYARGRPFRVDHTLGAAMMARREAIQQVGLLDERFYMYCEEIDWQMRMRAAGWEVYCVPAAHVTHLAARSTGQVRAESVVNLWRSRLRLYAKHYSRPWLVLARFIIRLGMRRQMALARRRCAAGAITSRQRDALLRAYRTVSAL